MDITCAKCGEPWDSFGIREGDMEPDEAARFRRGEGCPACGFGTRCTSCDGTGLEVPAHKCNCQNGSRLASRLEADPAGRWRIGYQPNMRPLPEGAKMLRPAGRYECRDGWVERAFFDCPDCKPADRLPCPCCNGTGKLTVADPLELEIEAARSAIDASDEDGIEILIERGLI